MDALNTAFSPSCSANTTPCGGGGRWARLVDLAWHRPRTAASLAAPTATDEDAPGPPCLTHRELLVLIDPFVRQGRRLNLCASDRRERRLVFKPVPLEGSGLHETLALGSPAPGHVVLARLLSDGSGLQSRVQAEGSDTAALLAQLQAVSVARLWRAEAGWTLAHDWRLPLRAGGSTQLVGSELRLPNLTLYMDVGAARAGSATLTLQPGDDGPRTLPDDLLAVLGWSWSSLRPLPGGGWGASLRLCGDPALRGRVAEAQLLQAARHLAQTLAQPPRPSPRPARHALWRGPAAQHPRAFLWRPGPGRCATRTGGHRRPRADADSSCLGMFS